jgi:hypothetical protein
MGTNNKLQLIIVNLFFLIISLLFIEFIIGLRPLNAGNDTPLYIATFNAIDNFLNAYHTGVAYFGSKEPGFWILSGLIKNVSNNPHIWLSLNILIPTIISASIYLKLSKQYHIELWTILFFGLFLTYEVVFMGGAMRQAFSIPLIAFYLFYLYNNSYIKALIFLSLATLFHFSSLLFLPIFIIFRYNLFHSQKTVFFLLIVSLLLGINFTFIAEKTIHLVSIQPLIDKYNLYILNHFEGELANRSIFSSLNMVFSFFLILITFISFNKQNFFYTISIYFLLLFMLFIKFPVIEVRILSYYIFFYPFIIYLILHKYIQYHYITIVFFSTIFYFLGLSTFLRESTQYTLGL